MPLKIIGPDGLARRKTGYYVLYPTVLFDLLLSLFFCSRFQDEIQRNVQCFIHCSKKALGCSRHSGWALSKHPYSPA